MEYRKIKKMTTDMSSEKMFPLLEKVAGWLKEAGLEHELRFNHRDGYIAILPVYAEDGESEFVMMEVSKRDCSVDILGWLSRPVPEAQIEAAFDLLEGVSDFRGYIVAPCHGEHWCASKYLKEDELSKELLLAEVMSARSVVKECNRLLAPLWRGE